MTVHLGAPDLLTGPVTTGLSCSAKGCRRAAAWTLAWNNPRLHTPDRRKTWLACDEHRVTLGEFLSVRGFLRETTPLPSPGGPVAPPTDRP